MAPTVNVNANSRVLRTSQAVNRPTPAAIVRTIQVVSAAHPTALELQASEQLKSVLQANGSYEPQSETTLRIQVLQKLNGLAKKWIQTRTEDMKLDISNPGGQIVAFGSYRMGVHSSGGDIDSVLLAPRHITREDFFISFKRILMEHPEVKNLVAIETAFVPIMTLQFQEVEVDISFARLSMREVPQELDVMNDSILNGLDDKSIRSLNGCRVAEHLLASVPNQKEYVLTLRAIKMWAKRRGIDKNTTGFFGGVTWAILTARVCQLWPNATASVLVEKFFLCFSTWKWPTPVFVHQMNDENTTLQSMVWNPRINMADRYHLMPILTPAYPQQNTTFNVSKSTASVIKQELKNGFEMMEKLKKGESTLEEFFEELPFFNRYKHYIGLVQSAETEEEELKFSGFFQSKIRLLVQALELNKDIKLAHCDAKKHKPSPRAKMAILKDSTKKTTIWTVGLEFQDYVKAVDLTRDIEKFKNIVSTQSKSIGLDGQIQIDAFYMKRSELFYVVKDLPVQKKKPVKRAGEEVEGAAQKKQRM